MSNPKKVLYFAENALSAIQGGGIVAYAVLKGLPAENLLGFYEYRNITPVPEYTDRFVYLGMWRTPKIFQLLNTATRRRTTAFLQRLFTEPYTRKDLAFVEEQVERRGFEPEVVYFAGLSYRYLRLAVLAAERYDVPMVILHMDDWMAVEREHAGRWGALWARKIGEQLTRAAARSLVSTSNSPRLAAKLTDITGYRHVPANNCCSDLMEYAVKPDRSRPNRIPIITYAGAMNRHLQGETLKVLASAVTELNAEGTRVQLHIYAPWEFAPDANAVAVPHAVFYKGHVGREQLTDIYRRADFLVTTVTYRESNISLFRHSLSTKLSEYLCVGAPVISMGHRDWHLHEYVQDNGCGFSILMDENFSRARIKEQLRRILSTDPALLERIGRNNRALWERAHDVTMMAQASRQAIGLTTMFSNPAAVPERRGAIWLGDPIGGWVPLPKLKTIARRLVDVFDHNSVDLIGNGIGACPELDALASYCRDIGLATTIVFEPGSIALDRGYEPAGRRWSLADDQRRPDAESAEPQNVFQQVRALRGETTRKALTAAERVINQLSVRVAGPSADRPVVWVYGSTAIGLDIIDAIKAHRWLAKAVDIGGFLSSAGQCKANVLHGYPWRSADGLLTARADFIVVASETSRLPIQEELSCLNLLDRMIPAYGMAATGAVYERDPEGPGQAFIAGSSANEYAMRELVARTSGDYRSATMTPTAEDSAIGAAA